MAHAAANRISRINRRASAHGAVVFLGLVMLTMQVVQIVQIVGIVQIFVLVQIVEMVHFGSNAKRATDANSANNQKMHTDMQEVLLVLRIRKGAPIYIHKVDMQRYLQQPSPYVHVRH